MLSGSYCSILKVLFLSTMRSIVVSVCMKYRRLVSLKRHMENLSPEQEKERNELLTGGVAQLGEHLLCKQGVRSSILLISTTRDKRKDKN